MLTRIALTLCFIALFPLSAQAKTNINDAGADRLKAIFSDYLDTQKSALSAQGAKLVTEGDMLIEQADSYYAITMPAITLDMGDGAKFKLGLISINAVPTEKPEEWKMSLSIPTPFVFRNKKSDLFRFNIGKQKAGGIYNEKLNTFSTFASVYEDMNLEYESGLELMTLDKIIVKTNYEPDENNKWSGDAKFNLSGLKVEDQDDDFSIKIGALSGLAEIGAFDPTLYKAAQKEVLGKMEALNGEVEEITKAIENRTELNLEDAKKLKEQANDMALSAFDLLLKAMNKSTLTLYLSDIDISGTSKKTQELNTLKLDNVLLNAGIDGLNNDKADMIYALSFDGLDVKPAPEDSELMPTRFKTQLKLNKLPINQLIEIGTSAMNAKTANPEAGGLIAMRSLMSLPQILSNAGTTLELTDSYIGNNLYNTKVDAKVKTSTASLIGAVGEANVTITNLDKMTALIKSKLDSETDARKKRRMQGTLQQLELLRKVGRHDGSDTVAKFELNEQGQTLVNGQDLKAVMSGNAETIAQ